MNSKSTLLVMVMMVLVFCPFNLHAGYYDFTILRFEGKVTDIYSYGNWDETSDDVTFWVYFDNTVKNPWVGEWLCKFLPPETCFGRHAYFGPVFEGLPGEAPLIYSDYPFPSLPEEVHGNHKEFITYTFNNDAYLWDNQTAATQGSHFHHQYEGSYNGFDWRSSTQILGSTNIQWCSPFEITSEEFETYLINAKDNNDNFSFSISHDNYQVEWEGSETDYYGEVQLEKIGKLSDIGDIPVHFTSLGIKLLGHMFGLPTVISTLLAVIPEYGWHYFVSGSPVDISIVDENGFVYDKYTTGLDNYFYIEHDLTDDGKMNDLILYNNFNGKLTIHITPEAGADPNDIYSLVAGIFGENYNVTAYGLGNEVKIGKGKLVYFDTNNPAPASAFEPVTIDIKPSGEPNCIKVTKKGVTPVAILASVALDAKTIDVSTIEIDDDNISGGGVACVKSSTKKDVNGDGLLDLVMHFSTPQLNSAGLLVDGNILYITGTLDDSTAIIGSDIINLAGGPNCF